MTLWRVVSSEESRCSARAPPISSSARTAGLPRAARCRSSTCGPCSRPAPSCTIGSTTGFRAVGALPVQSISGGTDIMGCFVLGNPNLPVRAAGSSAAAWGSTCRRWAAAPSVRHPVGELVCRNPFPSARSASSVTTAALPRRLLPRRTPASGPTATLIELDAAGQARIHGRSDGVLHIHGVRIGPAEIYRALRDVPEVREAMAVEQRAAGSLAARGWCCSSYCASGSVLDGRLTIKIRRAIVATPLRCTCRSWSSRSASFRDPQRKALRAGREGRGERPAGGQPGVARQSRLPGRDPPGGGHRLGAEA